MDLEKRPEETNGIMTKLLEVQGLVEKIEKRGWNENQKYSFVREADLMAKLNRIFVEKRVHTSISTIDSKVEHLLVKDGGREKFWHFAQVTIRVTWTDLDTMDQVSIDSVGHGKDIGDKAIYKAVTGAVKYALLKNFIMESTDDPEDEKPEKEISPEDIKQRNLELMAKLPPQIQQKLKEGVTPHGRKLTGNQMVKICEGFDWNHEKLLIAFGFREVPDQFAQIIQANIED